MPSPRSAPDSIRRSTTVGYPFRFRPWPHLLLVGMLLTGRAMELCATAQTVEALGIGTAALLGGDLTDPENDGNEAAGPFDPSWNWRAITSNNEPGFGGGEYSFNLFDNRVGAGNDKWCCDDPTFTNPLWVNVEFHQPVSLTHFTVTSGNDDPTRDPRNFRVQGSNDGVTYTDLYVRSSGTAPWNQRNQVLKFTLAQPAPPYLHLRWVSLDTSGSLHQLNEVEYFGTVVPLPFTVDNRFNPTGVYVVFEQPVDPATIVPGNFTVAGLDVTSAQVKGDGRTVVLSTAAQTEGQTYTLTVQGVLHADGGAVAASPITRHWTHGFGVVAHRITHDRWDGIAGTTTDIVTGLPTYPDRPSFTAALPRFEIPPDIADNYGGRIYGLFIPPSDGSYLFFNSSDDQSQLFLSLDAIPSNAMQIAREPNWNGSRQYITGINQASRGNPPANISAPVNLTQGQPVWLELVYKEGAGGDNASATAQFPGGAAIVNGSLPLGEEHFALRYRQGPDGTRFQAYGPVAITQPPSGVSVVEGATVTLTAVGDGSPPHRWQWRRNGDVVDGATGSTHSFTAVPGTEGSYTVTLANDFSEATSAPAVVNVAFDTTAPTLVSVSGTESRNRVRVQFSEPVDAATATTLANYSLTGPDGPLSITAANLVNASLVELLTAKQAEGALFTLTVNHVTDTALAKNPIAPNASAEFSAYVFITGAVLHRRWNGVDTLAGLTGLARFPDRPDEVTLEPLPEYPPNGGNEAGTGYGNLLTFWWTPPETGDYEFFLSADDQAELWLSTDDDPANKKRIAVEPSWNNPRQWVSTERRNAAAPENRSTTYLDSQWPGGPGPIHLEAGQRYFLEAVHAEASGGDNVGVNVRRVPTSPARATPTEIANGDAPNLPADEVGISVPLDATRLKVLGQPEPSVTVLEGRTVTLSADVEASLSFGPVSAKNLSHRLQWQCAEAGTDNWVDVPGANSETFTPEPLSVDDSGRKYRLITWIGISRGGIVGAQELTSDVVTVTLLPDTQPPSILRVAVDGQALILSFDEKISPSSVMHEDFQVTPFNSVEQLNILAATLDPAGDELRLDLGEMPVEGEWYSLRACVGDPYANSRCDDFRFRYLKSVEFGETMLGLVDFYLPLNEVNSITRPDATGSERFGVNTRDGQQVFLSGVPGVGASDGFPGLSSDNLAFLGTGVEYIEVIGNPMANNLPGFTATGFFKCSPVPDGPPPYVPTYNTIISAYQVLELSVYNPGHGTEGAINFRTAQGGSVQQDIVLGQWYFFGAIANGSYLSLYLSGLPPKTGGTPTSNYGEGSGIRIGAGGAFDPGSHSFLRGKVDEIAFVSRALSETEISTILAAATANANVHPPTVIGPETMTCEVGQTCTAAITVTDPDTDSAEWKLTASVDNEDILEEISFGGEGDNRTISFTPVAPGNTNIRVDAFDGKGRGTLLVSIMVAGNRPPEAKDDSYTVSEDPNQPLTGNVLDNDIDFEDGKASMVANPGERHTAGGPVNLTADGRFTFMPGENFNGTISFTYEAADSNGATDQATVTITVNAVNDAPIFGKGLDQTVKQDAGTQTVPNWATGISPGPASAVSESRQVLTFMVSNDNNALFAVQPAISPDGTLTFTPSPGAHGTATVTAVLKDDGGTANGGVDTSAPQTFTIEIRPVTQVVLTVEPPQGDEFRIRWIDPENKHHLEATPSLNPPSWRPVLMGIQRQGDEKTFLVPTTGDGGYFRLQTTVPLTPEAQAAVEAVISKLAVPAGARILVRGPVPPETAVVENTAQSPRPISLKVPDEAGAYYVAIIDPTPGLKLGHPMIYVWINLDTMETGHFEAQLPGDIVVPGEPPAPFVPIGRTVVKDTDVMQVEGSGAGRAHTPVGPGDVALTGNVTGCRKLGLVVDFGDEDAFADGSLVGFDLADNMASDADAFAGWLEDNEFEVTRRSQYWRSPHPGFPGFEGMAEAFLSRIEQIGKDSFPCEPNQDCCHEFFLYLGAHGSSTTLNLYDREGLGEVEFVDFRDLFAKLAGFPPCVKIVVFIDACRAGGAQNYLADLCENRPCGATIVTTVDASHGSQGGQFLQPDSGTQDFLELKAAFDLDNDGRRGDFKDRWLMMRLEGGPIVPDPAMCPGQTKMCSTD